MDRNFYLRKQAEIVSGSALFAAQILADFAALGLANSQATAFGVLNTSLQAAWSVSSNPETRTPVAVEATREAIKSMRAMAIPLAKQIAGNPAVSNAQLIGLGLLPRTSPTPIPAEMTAPVMEIIDVNGRLVKVGVRQAGVETKSRPRGSNGAYVYSFVGSAAPTDPSAYKFEGLASRNTFLVQFPDDVPGGATAFITVAWVSRRGQRGFACTPQQVTLQGGPVMPAEELA